MIAALIVVLVTAGVWLAIQWRWLACRLFGHPGFVGTLVPAPVGTVLRSWRGVEQGGDYRYECARCRAMKPEGWGE